MTQHTNEPAATAEARLSPQTSQILRAECRSLIRDLTGALEVMTLAVTTADAALHDATVRPLTAVQTLGGWQHANLLVDTVFRSLAFEVGNALEMLRLTQPPR
jgi:hypothetical protein